jgi:transcriptional regulator with XRE-family HTH domain
MPSSTKKRRTSPELTGLGALIHNQPTGRELTPAQQAVIDLRRALNLTQQKLANLMGKSMVTVARWESSRPPTGASLYELLLFAHRHGQEEIARTLADVIGEAGNPQNPLWTDLDREVSFAAATVNLSRNAHITRAHNLYKKALERLRDAHALLVEAARDGAALHPDTPLDVIEYDQTMLERMLLDAQEKK